MSVRSVRLFLGCSIAALIAAGAAQAQTTAPIVQPGAPGQASRVLEAQAAALEQMRRQMEEMQSQLSRLSGAPPKP